MKQIILFPKGTLDPDAKKLLKKAGCVPLEVEDPSKVVMMMPSLNNLTGDMVIRAALTAMSGAGSGTERQKFGESIINQIISLRNQPTK